MKKLTEVSKGLCLSETIKERTHLFKALTVCWCWETTFYLWRNESLTKWKITKNWRSKKFLFLFFPVEEPKEGDDKLLPASVQFISVAQSCPTLCNPMNYSTPGFPVLHQFLELAQTCVHRIGDAIQSSNPLSSPSLPAFNLSQYLGPF